MISINRAPAARRKRWMLAVPILALLVAAAWPTTAAAKEVVTGNMECHYDIDSNTQTPRQGLEGTAMVAMAGTFKLAAVSARTGKSNVLTQTQCNGIVDGLAAFVASNRECAVGNRFLGDEETRVGFACSGAKGKMIRIIGEILDDLLNTF